MHKRTRMSSRLQRRKTVEAYLFSAPWIIGFLIFFTYPVVTSFILSFSRITNIQGLKTTFVGLTHYKQAFTFDINFVPMFLRVVRTTLIQTVLILIFSFIIARFVNRKMVLRGFSGRYFSCRFCWEPASLCRSYWGRGLMRRLWRWREAS